MLDEQAFLEQFTDQNMGAIMDAHEQINELARQGKTPDEMLADLSSQFGISKGSVLQ